MNKDKLLENIDRLDCAMKVFLKVGQNHWYDNDEYKAALDDVKRAILDLETEAREIEKTEKEVFKVSMPEEESRSISKLLNSQPLFTGTKESALPKEYEDPHNAYLQGKLDGHYDFLGRMRLSAGLESY